MKITFNLSKPEAEAFKNFYTIINQPNLSEVDFAKTAFMMGLQAMERAILSKMKDEVEAEKGEAAPEIVDGEDIAEVTETLEDEVVVNESTESTD